MAKRKKLRFKKLSEEEMRLIRMWFRQDKKSPLEIAKLLHRAKSTITRYLFQQRAKALGRPVVITPAVLDKILVNLKKYIETAKNRYRITVKVLKQRLKLKYSERTILEALPPRQSQDIPLQAFSTIPKRSNEIP